MGMDDKGRVYIGFTSFRDGGKSEDFVVFRYDPGTEQRDSWARSRTLPQRMATCRKGKAFPKATRA